MLMYLGIENFLNTMKKEGLNEFRIKMTFRINDYSLTPLDKNGYFENNLRNDLSYNISKEDLEELLTFLNYNPNDKLHNFFKIDKDLPNNDSRSHLYPSTI